MDHLIQGESGMFMATGTEEQPVRVGFAVADAGTAIVASSAVLGALVRMGREGAGAFLDVSMLESCMALMGLNYYNFFATGKVGPRVGPNPLAQIGSAGTWKTKDGVLLVNANNQRLFERMARALGRGDLLEDDRFRDINASSKHRDELRAIFGEIFSTDSANHWDDVLRKAGVPSGQLKSLDEVVQHPQLKFRKSFTTISDVPGMDDALTFLGAGFTVDDAPTGPTSVPPTLGRDSDEILTEAGINPLEIKRLRKIGVIV
jgi:crotonobetainyl-CoA:carnitine CoA-transferase CaiB-like acyl-CoA transferase